MDPPKYFFNFDLKKSMSGISHTPFSEKLKNAGIRDTIRLEKVPVSPNVIHIRLENLADN